jgi:excisionase family DNA binding protein
MPRTKRDPEQNPQPTVPPISNGPLAEILTLAEAAAYLRLPETEVIRLVNYQDLPGRLAGTEWRFLKSAIQEWLRQPIPRPSKEAQLAAAGMWKDDPYAEEELKEILKNRGRATSEDEP